MRVLVAVPAERDGAGVFVAAAVKLLGFVGWVQERAVAQHPLLVLPLCKTRAIGFSDSERVVSTEREKPLLCGRHARIYSQDVRTRW